MPIIKTFKCVLENTAEASEQRRFTDESENRSIAVSNQDFTNPGEFARGPQGRLPELTIQNPVLDRLADMFGLDSGDLCHIGDGPRYPQNLIVSSC